jgi:hypothetical protein
MGDGGGLPAAGGQAKRRGHEQYDGRTADRESQHGSERSARSHDHGTNQDSDGCARHQTPEKTLTAVEMEQAHDAAQRHDQTAADHSRCGRFTGTDGPFDDASHRGPDQRCDDAASRDDEDQGGQRIASSRRVVAGCHDLFITRRGRSGKVLAR